MKTLLSLLATLLVFTNLQAAEPATSNPKRVELSELTPALDGVEIVVRFRIGKVIWLSGGVPKGGIRTFSIVPMAGKSDPRFSALIMGDLARVMDRFGYSPPQSKHPLIGKSIELRGKIRMSPPPKKAPEKGPVYSLRASDWRGFRLRS